MVFHLIVSVQQEDAMLGQYVLLADKEWKVGVVFVVSNMLLLLAILFILFEAVIEGLLKRFNKVQWLFDNFLQWLTAIFLFGVWFVIAYHFDGYYVPIWKLITGFVFVRFGIFDIAYNLSNGQRWNYYGTTKLYDRIMEGFGGFGQFIKAICFIVGCVFLIGWN